MPDEARPEPMQPARVVAWTLTGTLSGALGAALLLFGWSEASGAGQDLGFLHVLLDVALLGAIAGGLVGLLLGLTREAVGP